jgi:hypothetical protein
MKIRKLLVKARSLLDAKERKSKVKKKSIKHIIKKLRKREKALQGRLKKEPSKSKSAKISEQINLTHAQRKKGLKVLKKLKNP